MKISHTNLNSVVIPTYLLYEIAIINCLPYYYLKDQCCAINLTVVQPFNNVYL